MSRTQITRVAMLAFATTALQPLQAQERTDPLWAGFEQPPQEARPRVWWHWMNGNITEDGIRKDIDWMRRIGIGGLQNFDASLLTPQVVDRRLAYMTPEWKHAFRFAADQSQAAGLELAIAGSPGWSETGGPWVEPEDGIKKVTWSETVITDGSRFDGVLAKPSDATGPYQSISAEGSLGLAREGAPPSHPYRDIAVFAVRLATPDATATAVARDARGRALDAQLLSDGELSKAIDVGVGSPSNPPILNLSYPGARTMRSATLFMPDPAPSFSNPRFSPILEGKVGGKWRRLATFQLAPVPTTVAFAAVRADAFRVVFAPFDGPPRPAQTAPAPGVVIPAFIATATGPFHARVAEFRLSGEARVDRAEAKAGFSLVNDYFSLKTSASSQDAGPDISKVQNLTGRLRPDGTLDWSPGKGSWRIIRMGWTLTGKTNHPASAEATGLEVDKLDGAAVSRYLRHYLDMYRGVAGDDLMGSRGVRALLLDSTEVGPFNWTPRMVEQFKRLRGYDPTPWLPVLTGMLVGTRDQSDRFLYDFRRTIAELHATEHYGTVAKVAHDYGLRYYGEALEDQRPVLGDDMSMRRYADIPMAALWTWADGNGPRPTLLGDMKGASSVGHLYGRNVVAAESMTSALSPWANAPADLRRVVDLEFASGINRPVIHTSVHQPLDKKPGLSLMIFGQFFNRNESWAEMAKPWIDYISRSSFLLQQGRNVADVAYFYGEESPLTAQAAFGPLAGVPSRYAYDFVNAEALTDLLKVDAGDLTAPSGARYRVLYLGPAAARMTVRTLRRLEALAEGGATIVGLAPSSSPSLADDTAEFATIVRRLWSGSATTRVGKGRVIASRDVEGALAALDVRPDVDLGSAPAARDALFVHRQLADGDLYFIVNRSKRPMALNARFRVRGKAPEIWHADTGTVEAASYAQDGRGTVVPLTLGGEESAFILFRKPSYSPARTVVRATRTPIFDLSGGWKVAFQPGRGAPSSIDMAKLASLTEQRDPGVRYFSGEATYRRTFTWPRGANSASRVWLDLGKVGDIAEVRLNGRVIGSAWHSPYLLEIGNELRPGDNTVEVRVANLWVNRLIGDAQPGAEKITFTTFETYKADAPLRPAGLIGPVRLIAGPR